MKRKLTPAQIENILIAIQKSEELDGRAQDPESLARARRVLTGEITVEEARAEVIEKYSQYSDPDANP